MPSSAHKEQVISAPAASARPAWIAARLGMSLDVAVDLVVCGVLLAGLSLVACRLQADFQRVTLFTGLVGGGLCVLWGVLGLRGTRCRVGAMVTLAAVACVFARQGVASWGALDDGESKGRMVMGLMAVLVVFCVGTVANLVRDGKKAGSHE